MTDDMPVIRIVDDDASMRESLADLLASFGFRTRTFPSVADFSARDTEEAGCLVLDVRMPGESGLTFFRNAAGSATVLPVIFISGHADVAMAVQAVRLGAVDFLAKPFAELDLLDAVNRAVAIDRDRRAVLEETRALQARFATLTPGERNVTELVATGLSNKEAAARLGVSEITVKVRRGHAMRKIGAATLPDLVRATDRFLASGALLGGPDATSPSTFQKDGRPPRGT